MSFEEYERDGSGAEPENLIGETRPETLEEPVPEGSAFEEPFIEDIADEEPSGFLRRTRPVQPIDVEERPAWSEPAYEPAPSVDRDVYTPGQYAYGVQGVREEPEEEEPEKEHRPHRFLRTACLLLACILVSGVTSWAVINYMIRHNIGGINNKQVILGSSVNAVPDDTRGDDISLPNGTLTANQIYYDLACQQVVGVNTSFTTNAFGMSTPRAVSGSGFIISEDGYILTNYHVISYAVVYDGKLTVLLKDGSTYNAKVVGYLESNDVAVIKIDAQGLKPVALGDSDKMLVGETVYAVGNPLGELDYSMTDGIVSAQDRMITTEDEITGTRTSMNMFQITAAVNSGNSGGPVYNSRGEVIGIVTAKYANEGIEGLGFAIPINDAVSIAKQIIERGYVAGAGLGIMGLDVTGIYSEIAMERYGIPYGVYVESVTEGSAAEQAGIHPGDIITKLGDRTVSSMNELQLALRSYSPGETQTITVYRQDGSMSGTSIDLTITFEERVEESKAQKQNQDQNSSGSWKDWFGWGW